jgi:hypothetical protein
MPTKRLLQTGDPVGALVVLRKVWSYGGAARAGISAWSIALVLAVATVVLAGVGGNHQVADHHVYGEVAAGLAGFVLLLVLLGGYLTYRGTGGFPKGWADERRP